MNKKVKKQANKIIIALIIVMLCNFVMPKVTFASNLNVVGGIFFKPIAQFIAWFADVAIQALQVVAIGDGTMKVENSPYLVRYSPGIIFSGKIPMFDINFISPDEDYEVGRMVANYDEILKSFSAEELELEGIGIEGVRSTLWSDSGKIGMIRGFFETGELKTESGKVLASFGKPESSGTAYTPGQAELNLVFSGEESFLYQFGDTVLTTPEERDYKKYFELINVEITDQTEVINDWSILSPWWTIDVSNVIYNGVLYEEGATLVQGIHKYYYGNYELYTYIIYAIFYSEENGVLLETDPENLACNVRVDIYKSELTDDFEIVESGDTIPSIAGTLKPFVATWYNVFKVVALVALLVVLVYVAIRMILSSTSKDKAKYKKMLVDWVTAVCIIFVMQYIISITLYVTSAISDFFAASVVGPYGEDVLMSEIRNSIGSAPDFMKVFAQIVMYVVLVVYTVLFTIQYLKRTIYMAFLTLISPLVAFTYPLDKLKDGKAQAFSAWLKEFIYTALVQPVHLIVYCLLVNSAIDFAKEVPIYAIIVIGFLLPAEKFVKKMFGLDKANTIGSMATTFGGVAIMNGINKLGLKGPKGPKGNGGSGSGGNGDSSKVRTANEGAQDPYDVLRQDLETNTNPGTQTSGNSDSSAQTKNKAKKKRKIKNKTGVGAGIGNVAKKYVLNKNTAKGLLRGAGKIAGAATLGTIGLAAGIATGEVENAFAGAAGGLAAGSRVGGNLVDGGADLIEGVSRGIKGIGDTYGEGAYGKEEYARMKFDKEFKKSEEYIKLIDKYPGRENDVQQFLDSGITDTKMMQKAMDKNYNIREAIAYMKMAQAEDCPNEILYDREKFKTYLESRGIPGSKAEEIRRGVIDFK